MKDNLYLLDDREKRYHEVLALISKHQLPVICGKLNYPGNDKNTIEAQAAFSILVELMSAKFGKHSVKSKILSGYDGKSLLIVTSLAPREAKALSLEIEGNHPLGRIFDIDVYVEGGASISRSSMGLMNRSCLVCGQDARICTRAQNHSLEAVLEEVNRLIRSSIPSLGEPL